MWKRESGIDRFLRQNSLFRVPTPAAVTSKDYETIARRVSAEIAEALFLPRNSQSDSTLVLLPANASDSLRTNGEIELPETLARKVKQNVLRLAPISMNFVVTTPKIFNFNLFAKTKTAEVGLDRRIKTWFCQTFFDPVYGGLEGRGWLSQKEQNVSAFAVLSVVKEKFPQIEELAFSIVDFDAISLRHDLSERMLRVIPGTIPNLISISILQDAEWQTRVQWEVA